MSDVVDFEQRRIDKAIRDSGAPVLGGPVPPGGQVVSVLGCSLCGGTEFRLGHADPISRTAENVVMCAKCCVRINSLAWYDVNEGKPTSA